MKRIKVIIGSIIISILGISCTDKFEKSVSVTNHLMTHRNNELVEIELKKLMLDRTSQIIVQNNDGEEIRYQLTYDEKIIFPIDLKPGERKTYKIKTGLPKTFLNAVYGKHYAEREDDIAWENDRVGFRVYGPPLQQRGEKAYGYDLFLKRVEKLALEEIYARELDTLAWKQIRSLQAAGKTKEAERMIRTISYHVDHGLGMDCYAVGPTLGAGTAALVGNDSMLIYPYCYKDYEILDNGPLRFTLKLTFHPFTMGNDSNVVETRLIQLDKGSQLNKTMVFYQNLTKPVPWVTGIVIHDSNPAAYYEDSLQCFHSYVDKTIEPDGENGLIFIGAVLPEGYEKIIFKETETPVKGASGHWLGFSTYYPDSYKTYYWGFGWSKFGFENVDDWNQYLADYKERIHHPLIVKID